MIWATSKLIYQPDEEYHVGVFRAGGRDHRFHHLDLEKASPLSHIFHHVAVKEEILCLNSCRPISLSRAKFEYANYSYNNQKEECCSREAKVASPSLHLCKDASTKFKEEKSITGEEKCDYDDDDSQQSEDECDSEWEYYSDDDDAKTEMKKNKGTVHSKEVYIMKANRNTVDIR